MFLENKAQEEAVRTHEGQVILISCPGSGKTTTMIRRIHEMICAGIPDHTIVMVTFTEVAAKEMKARYVREFGETNALFATIHSLCLRILMEFTTERLSVIPAEMQFNIVSQAFRDMKIYKKAEDLRAALTDISAFKNSDVDMKDFTPTSVDEEIFEYLLGYYESKKSEAGYIDFDDMICMCRDFLRKNQAALQTLRARYRYLMCDEYQDTNAVQKDILYLLAGPNGNLCVVGDDDQSIYGFRGAAPGIMLDFPKDFPNAKSIFMETNYRSEPKIIYYAKNLIGHNAKRFKKDIQASKNGEGYVKLQTCQKRSDELKEITEQIAKLIANGTDPKQIAVLSRTNIQLDGLAAIMEASKIPYKTADSIATDYEHFIFYDLIAYLTLMNGVWDQSAFLRILNRPSRYLKPALFFNVDGFNQSEMKTAALKHKPYDHKALENVRDLLKLFTEHRNESLFMQIRTILNTTGYRSFLYDCAENAGSDPAILYDKLDFLLKESNKYQTVNEWKIAARSYVMAHRDKIRKQTENAVTLSTMHRAKGLEWDHVFILDCCKSLMPGRASSVDELEEERRLFYVAMTRAKSHLYLCNYSFREKKSRFGEKLEPVTPCPFLEESKIDVAEKKRKENERIEKRRQAAKAMTDGFKEGDPSSFRIGMCVHHNFYGDGLVTYKTNRSVNVKFKREQKVFFLGQGA